MHVFGLGLGSAALDEHFAKHGKNFFSDAEYECFLKHGRAHKLGGIPSLLI